MQEKKNILKKFLLGRTRLKTAPFGNNWSYNTKSEMAMIGVFIIYVIIIFFCALAIKNVASVLCIVLTTLAFIWLLHTMFRDNVFSLIALGSLSDSEFDTLVREYKAFKEKNIIRYGIVTNYGIILDSGMLPWSNITRINVRPKTYHSHHGNVHSNPATVTFTARYGKKVLYLSQNLSEQYDLSDEIERFLDIVVKHTDPHCLIENEYYYEQ